jgi:transposase-like protein
MKCPHCGSNNLVKFGQGAIKGKLFSQRYCCKDCKKSTTKPKE